MTFVPHTFDLAHQWDMLAEQIQEFGRHVAAFENIDQEQTRFRQHPRPFKENSMCYGGGPTARDRPWKL
jgi:hypothetical protein